MIAEDKAYTRWEREIKNKILSMSNPEKKQAMWDTYFHRFEHSDDYLDGNIF